MVTNQLWASAATSGVPLGISALEGGENPTLTIVTLAIRQADYIAEAMRTNAI